MARFYDPMLGRFVQADTIIPEPGSSKGFDRYSYVNNNPVNYNDPSGHMVSCFDCGGSTLEKTLESFTKYGIHGSTFNEFYVQVYYAEKAISDAIEDNLIDEKDLINLKAHEDSVQTAYERGLNFVNPKDLTPSMFTYQQNNIVTRALAIASNVEGNIINYSHEQNETVDASQNTPENLFAVVIFGHSARHLLDLGLGQVEVEKAIATQVDMIVSSTNYPGPFWGRVIVNGQIIEYRAYPVGPNTINIGTYYPPKER